MIVDLALVRRVEHVCATVCVRQADALAGAHSSWLDGGALIAMGPDRYVNRAFGLGFGEMPAADVVEAATSFYGELGLPPRVELCPWADEALLAAFRSDGYAVSDFTSVFGRELTELPSRPAVHIECVDATTEAVWTSVHGARYPDRSAARAISDEFCAAMRRTTGSFDFLAHDEGRPAAAASFIVVDGAAWFGGAGTVVAHRAKGLQSALIAERLHRARGLGLELVVTTAVPTGPSARNLLRAGFQLLYTRAVLGRS